MIPQQGAATATENVDEVAMRGPLTTRGLSAVLPAHNEEAVIAETVRNCAETLAILAPDYEIIVVDDGSTDRTGAIVEALAAADRHIRVVHNQTQRGYGGALIAGFQAAAKSLIFFMDADGQFDIRDIALLLPLRERGYRAVLGYRKHRRDSLLRKINAWGWNVLVKLLFGLRVRDVDCAFKLYDAALVRAADVTAEGAMVNTEMLVKLSRLGVPFIQVPVRHYPRRHGAATGANLRVIAHAFRELFRLHGKLQAWHAELPPES
jgi:glycosyltransferase involved in cell wall biosynthesis